LDEPKRRIIDEVNMNKKEEKWEGKSGWRMRFI
jgi:hypothetical protein